MFRTLLDRLQPMFDEFESGGGAGAEELEAADPTEEESVGAEESEAADPIDDTSDDGRTDADAAFAEMRRQLEEAQRERQLLEADRDQYREALELFFDGDDTVAQAHAQATGRSVEEVKAEMEAQQRAHSLEAENQALSAKLRDYEVHERMANDLRDIQAIDPTVKSLDELGDTFLGYISAGLTGKQAYYATKAQEAVEKAVPPTEIGKVNQQAGEQSYYTRDEVAAMSQEEVSKNYDKIKASMSRW